MDGDPRSTADATYRIGASADGIGAGFAENASANAVGGGTLQHTLESAFTFFAVVLAPVVGYELYPVEERDGNEGAR